MHPSTIKNPFLGHMAFWLIFLPLLTIIFLPLFDYKADLHNDEIAMITRSGVDIDEVTKKVNGQFSAYFIHTGIMQTSEAFFSGGRPKQSIAGGASLKAAQMAGHWIRGVWVIIYRAMWRLNALSGIYLAALLAICLPSLIDGLSIRARKRYQFQNYNPVYFYFSYHAAVLVLGLLVYLPVVPITLTPWTVTIFLFLLGLSIWWAAANLQTGS